MKYPKHDQALFVEAVLKYIRSTENLQHDLAIFFPARDRPPESWMLRQDLHLADDLAGHDRGKRGMFSIKKFSETVEIGKGSVRPFQLH